MIQFVRIAGEEGEPDRWLQGSGAFFHRACAPRPTLEWRDPSNK
jgi:hypothetical protein